MSSAICFNLDQSKILSSGNGSLVPFSSMTSLYVVILQIVPSREKNYLQIHPIIGILVTTLTVANVSEPELYLLPI